MRNVNGVQLLNLIVEAGPISRASLAKLSRLSKPTVSEQVQRLIARGTVVELGEGEAPTSGGKRPTLIAFNAQAACVAAVSIGGESTRVEIHDLMGARVAAAELPTRPADGARQLIQRIRDAIARTGGAKVAGGRLRAISIGVPGRVDCDRGVVAELANVFNWLEVDLASPLQRKFKCPVLVDNDVNVALVGEMREGGARDVRSAVLIRLDVGLGAAIAMDGKIHHGAHWAAGEIGHLAPRSSSLEDGSPRGYLEGVVGADRIGARVEAAASCIPALKRLLKNEPPVSALFTAAREDPAAAVIAEEVTYSLCAAVSQHALVCDPEILLLSGEIFTHILPEIKNFLARTIPWPVQVTMAELAADDAVLRGATALALASFYERLSEELLESSQDQRLEAPVA